MAGSLREKVAGFPDKPGIYFFRDAEGKVLYIGKARSLRDRVRSYFLPGPDIKVRNILAETADIDYHPDRFGEGSRLSREQLHPTAPAEVQSQAQGRQELPLSQADRPRGIPGGLHEPQGRARRVPVFRPLLSGRPRARYHPPRQQVLQGPRLRGGRLPGPQAAVPGARPRAVLGALRRTHLRGRLQERRGRRPALSRGTDRGAGPEPEGADAGGGRRTEIRGSRPPEGSPGHPRGPPAEAAGHRRRSRGPGRGGLCEVRGCGGPPCLLHEARQGPGFPRDVRARHGGALRQRYPGRARREVLRRSREAPEDPPALRARRRPAPRGGPGRRKRKKTPAHRPQGG